MIGAKQNIKWFSLGTLFIVFFFGFFVQFQSSTHTVYAESNSTSEAKVAATPPAGDTSGGTPTKSGDDMGSYIGNAFMTVFKALLYGLLVFLAFIGSVAASAFLYVLDVSHFQAIMANPVVWEMWKIVRDFMNLFFIFVLLLSAFYTIFQVDKYSYKNVLSKVIFGALFVNFSFPIARAIIDVGNVMMYSFIVDIFGMTGGGLTNGILGTAGLADILVPKGFDKTYELKFYLIAIVCLFMFVVSFLTLALMMLFRLVMLPILVMFSPIGFVAGAIPGMDGYAKQWWDKLIKNVFFGPIAVFMMMISVKFLNVWGSSNAVKAGFSQAAVSSSDASGTLISGVVYMTIPVIFFWIAITSAEKMSSEAGGLANSFGSKFLKKAGGWGMKRAWQATGKNYVDGMKDKYNRTFHEPRGLGYSWRAKQAEMKKHDDEKRKQEDDAKAKPGKDAARKAMDAADKATIDRGAVAGASAKDKAAGIAALKRFNERKRTANNEEIKKHKQRLEDSGEANDPSALLARIKVIDAKGATMSREERLERAALSSHLGKAQSHMSNGERSEFIKNDPAVREALGTDYSLASGVDPTTLTGDALARYNAEELKYIPMQIDANNSLSRIRAGYPGLTPEAADKQRNIDQAVIEKFLRHKATAAVRDGDGHDTDRRTINP